MKKNLIWLFIIIAFSLSSQPLDFTKIKLEPLKWNLNGAVHAMVKDTANGLLYLGGEFTTVTNPGNPIINHAEVNKATGVPAVFPIQTNGIINTIISDGNSGWYIGGDFTEVGGVNCSGIAHVLSNGTTANTFIDKGVDGVVNTLLLDNDLYVGGNFSRYGDVKHHYAVVDAVQGDFIENSPVPPNTAFPETNGEITAVEPDGNGGWYVAGRFSEIGGFVRIGLAHIKNDGTVGNLNVAVHGDVNDMKLTSIGLYLAGSFTTGSFTNGNPNLNSNLALIELNGSGTLNGWNPSPNGAVHDVEIAGNTIYVCGDFSQIGGVVRNGLAALNTSGAALSWNPGDSNSDYFDIEIDGYGLIWVGGFFQSIAGIVSPNLACIDPNGIAITGANLGVNGPVRDIEIDNNKIYIAGFFNQVDAQPRKGYAIINQVNSTTSNLSAIKLQDSGLEDVSFDKVKVSGNEVYLAGTFNEIAGKRRSNLVKANLAGFVQSWNPGSMDPISDVAVDGGHVFLAGYRFVEGEDRFGLMSISLGVGVTPFHQDVMFSDFHGVNCIEKVGSDLYAGGSWLASHVYNNVTNEWDQVNSGNLIEYSNSILTTASLPFPVLALASVGGNLLLAGADGIVIRNGNQTNFKNIGRVNAIEVIDNNNFFVGGDFENSPFHLAKVNIGPANTLTILPWDAKVDGPVNAILKDNNDIIIGGEFNYVGKEATSNLAKLDIVNGFPSKTWKPNPNAPVDALADLGASFFARGSFTKFGATVRTYGLAFNTSTGELADWNPKLDGPIYDMLLHGNNMIAVGSFTKVKDQERIFIAEIGLTANTLYEPTSWYPSGLIQAMLAEESNGIFCVEPKGGTVLLGGDFNPLVQLAPSSRNNLAEIDLATGTLTSWNASTDGPVYSIETIGNEVFVGGSFSTVGNVGQATTYPRQNLASFINGTPTSFSPNPNGDVKALLRSAGGIRVGGDFTTIASLTRNGIAEMTVLNATPWNPNIDGQVNVIKNYKGSTLVGGDFDNVNGANKSSFAAIESNGNSLGFTPGFSRVYDIETTPSRLFVAGSFGIKMFINEVAQPVIGLSGNNEPIDSNNNPDLNNQTNFGKQFSNAGTIKTFLIENTGDADLVFDSILSVSISGSSDFSIIRQPAEKYLRAGRTDTLEIEYTPSQFKTAEATVTLNTNLSPFNFNIKAEQSTALNFTEHAGSPTTYDYVEVPTSIAAGLNELTVEAWIKTDATSLSPQAVLSSSAADFIQLQLEQTPTIGNVVYTDVGALSLPSIPVTPTDVWRHVALVAKSGDTRLYVEGVQVGPTITTAFTSITSPTALHIGNGFQNARPFDGAIDELRIWSRALCSEEILGRKESSTTGNELGLLLFYDFEEGAPNEDNTAVVEVIDKVSGNNGILQNFTKLGSESNWVFGAPLSDEPDPFVGNSSNTWLGSTSMDWNNGSNWSTGSVPGICSDVIIQPASFQPDISDNQTVNSIVIMSGADLHVSPGACLWVGSTFTNDGDFILEASSIDYAQYMGPSVWGTMKQVIDEEGWHTIGSPFTDAKVGDITLDEGAKIEHGGGVTTCSTCNLWYYNNEMFQASPSGSSSWNEAWGTWVTTNDANDPFDGTRGYNLFLAKGYFMSGDFPVTLQCSGTLRGDEAVFPKLLRNNGGWTLLSNPYPSVLDWSKVKVKPGIADWFYVWSAANANYATYISDAFAFFGVKKYIAPFQSIMVRTDPQINYNGSVPDPPSSYSYSPLDLNNFDRPTSCVPVVDRSPFYKREIKALKLVSTSLDFGYHDELIIALDNQFVEGYNPEEDVSKLFTPEQKVPSFFAVVEDNACVLASYPEPIVSINHVPLGFSTKKGNRISISATDIPFGIKAILEDKALHVFHDMSSPYDLISSEEDKANRFVLHVGNENMRANDVGGLDDYLVYQKDNYLQFVTNLEIIGGEALLFTVTGQLVGRNEVEENGRMDVSRLNMGIYILRIVSNGRSYQQKVFIK